MSDLQQANTLERFVRAQAYNYQQALAELRGGRKRTHWMWYVFPQLRGLGKSGMAYLYGIADLEEARAYLAHPVLGPRLTECCEALLAHSDKSAVEILGYTDGRKLQSSMTLFARISRKDSVFHRVLQQYYGGKADELTLQMLSARG